MRSNRPIRLFPRLAWIALALVTMIVAGSLIAGCANNQATPTPTPTKTPRPADTPTPAIAAATIAPTVAPADTPVVAEPQTVVPTAAPTDAATPATTAMSVPPPTAVKLPPPTVAVAMSSSMASPDYGVQAFLWWRPEVADRDLQAINDAGFTWVKQLISWQDVEGAGKGQFDWTNADRLVEQVQQKGLKLIVRVSQDPDRPFWAGNPPDNVGDYADFLAALASRYHGRIHAYQIWNEPNLAREWGNRRPDPAAYSRMLKAAYSAIKTIDPNAIVVTAGMAPTTQDNDLAMPDLKFYDEMYQAMNSNSTGYFDMLGVHGAGYAVAPETDPSVVANDPKLNNNDPSSAELKRTYAFRHIEDVRALMERYGDQGKRVVVLEFGWSTDNRPDSPYYWHGAGAGINETVQGCYLLGALIYAKEHWQPWIGLMSMIYMPDVDWTKGDEQYYWSIIGPGYPDFYLRAPYVIIQNYLTKGVVDDACQQYK